MLGNSGDGKGSGQLWFSAGFKIRSGALGGATI